MSSIAWDKEGIELGHRLAAELEPAGIKLPMELTALLNDADAAGADIVEKALYAAARQRGDVLSDESEQAIAEACAWLALYAAWKAGRHEWEHEAWLVAEAVNGALMRPLTGEDNGELSDLLGRAWLGEQAMGAGEAVRYAAATLAEGRRQLAARPDAEALARAVRLEERFAFDYDAAHTDHVGYYDD